MRDEKNELGALEAEPESSRMTNSRPIPYHEPRPNSSASSSSFSSRDGVFLQDTQRRSPFTTHLTARPRKRPTDVLDPDLEYPDSKSRRPTPSPAVTAAPSPYSATDSSEFDCDDAVLRSILGDDYKEEAKKNKEYLRAQEAKRKQEAEDEAHARRLQESFDFPVISQPTPQAQANASVQSFFNANGTLHRPVAAPSPWPQSPTLEGVGSYRQPQSAAVEAIDLEDSDSDIEVITGTEWTSNSDRIPWSPRFQPLTGPRGNLVAASPSMPGAFPGSPAYGGQGGTSVYGMGLQPPRLNLPSHLLGYNDLTMDTNGALNSYAAPITIDDWDFVRPSGYNNAVSTEDDIKEFLANVRPDEELSDNQRIDTPDAMEISLMPHQKLGLAWMMKMELGSSKGGVLADDMGLGKTIQALALIVANKPLPNLPTPTLIVAPVALLHQWDREAFNAMKRGRRLRVLTVHGDRGRRVQWRALQQYDIVLTTYGTLASEFKRYLGWMQRKRMDRDAQINDNDKLLLLDERVRFWRVILDESQCIKNRRTKAALAACQIQSQYRWCLTGTPMQNGVDEFQSLLKFTRIRPYDNWEQFSRDIARPIKASGEYKNRAMRQLQTIVRATTLRRTKNSKIDGQPILQLPQKTIHENKAVFSDDERAFYEALEQKSAIQFNKYLKAGTVGRNYSNVLVLLLRLRQACCHPHLIRDIAINTGGIAGLDMAANARELSRAVVERLGAIEAFECPVCMDAVINTLITNPCGHTLCEECLGRLVDSSMMTNDAAKVICPSCRTELDTSKTTDHQSLLSVHFPERASVAQFESDKKSESSDDDVDSSSDEDDKDSEDDLTDFVVPDDEPIDDDVEDEEHENEHELYYKTIDSNNVKDEPNDDTRLKKVEKPKKSKKGKGKKKDAYADKSLAQLRKEGMRNKSAKKAYLRRLRKGFQTSAKIEQTIQLLESIHEKNPSDKTLIFSGFTTFLDLLEVPLSRHPHLSNYVRYDGSMSAKSRTEAVEYFTDKPECKAVLISLKAGNAGLNLTKANHVIILDPHWNYYTEAQAIDRAHRLGQMKPVEVHRMFIDGEGLPNGTVEDRILELQEKKRQLVESALDENEGRSVARLGVRELGYLFVSDITFCPTFRLTLCRVSAEFEADYSHVPKEGVTGNRVDDVFCIRI